MAHFLFRTKPLYNLTLCSLLVPKALTAAKVSQDELFSALLTHSGLHLAAP